MKTGPKSRSTKQVRSIIQKYGCDLIGEYTNWKDKLQIKCLCGHIRLMRMSKFLDKRDSHLCCNCSGARVYGLSTEYVRNVIESFGCKLIGEYHGATRKIQIKCPCGNIRETKFHVFIRSFDSHLCQDCSPNPKIKTSQEIKEGFENKGFRFIGNKNVLGIHTKINVIDDDGYKYNICYDQLYNSRVKNKVVIKKFYYSNPFVLENMNLFVQKRGDKIKILDTWLEGKRLKVKSLCLDCKEKWVSDWLSIMYGHLCSHCAHIRMRINGKENTFAFLYPELLLEWDYEKNILPPEFYAKASTQKAWWICSACGHKWYAFIRSRSYGAGCPNCCSPKMEKRVKKFFENNEIEFIPQYRFNDCSNILPLPFDFAIFNNSKLSFLCEVQGEQHYKIIPFFGGEESFAKRQKNDLIKEQYCLSHDIPLIKIPYWNFSRIEEILTNLLL